MNVVFRVDSSVQMGIGHLMRCLTLANELEQKNHNITFICRKLKGNSIRLINHKVIALSIDVDFRSKDVYLNWLGAEQEDDAEQTIKVIPKDIDYLIVDSYALDEKWHQKLRPHIGKIMVIDDLADRQLDCDVLLNQNLGVQEENYKGKVPNGCEMLLGCDYALLRPEFANLRERALKKRRSTKEIKNILVSMGGSDNENITYHVLQEIADDLNIVVVLGSSSPHNAMIESYARNRDIEVVIDAKNMSELMLNADLAIGAGGSTSWERCCLGLPALVYIIGEDQKKIVESLEKFKAVRIVKNLKQDMQKIVNNFTLWKDISRETQSICDGLGAKKTEMHLGNLQRK
jgi:UDP-2,4-diacetamido-2,4,6-trideoxy-beta-L-altropyranose hydrolase